MRARVLLAGMSVLAAAAVGSPQDFGELVGMHVGCFMDSPQAPDLEQRLPGLLNTVALCTQACKTKYFKYAGLQHGRECWCGSEYGRHGPGLCNVRCTGNSAQICGGVDSNTVYKTGINVPGPPRNLRHKPNRSPFSLSVAWEPPSSTNGIILQYRVTADLIFSYNPDRANFQEKSLTMSNSSTTANILGLLAGSQYNVTVAAVSAFGSGPSVFKQVWTEVGTPKVPDTPTLVRHHMQTKDGTIHARLYPVGEYFGPITAYWVITLDETFPTPFNNQTLYDYEKAMSEGLSYWITAELDPSYLNVQKEFIVGDNRVYGGYKNYGPLFDHDYHISLAAISKLNGVTKMSFAKVSHEQHSHDNIIVFKFHGDEEEVDYEDDHDHDHGHNHEVDHEVHERTDERNKYTVVKEEPEPIIEPETMSSVLVAAIVISSLLLLAALLFFVFIRYSIINKFRRRRADTQELTTNIPASEPLENGYIDNGAFEQEDRLRTAEDYLESLDGKVWQIPRNFVDVQTEVLGRGLFGTVMKGTVNINQEPVPANIYIIPNKMMEKAEKQSMLRNLDLNVKAKFHNNIVNLLGICEEQETTLVVLDAVEMELKQFLLDSRALETHPSYAAKSDRFTSMKEEDALGIMVGIAQGLEHLVNCGVQIKDLSARNVYISNNLRTKIFGFGLAEYNKRVVSLDFTRWNAPETLLKNQFSSKSIVWSYGCVMWEVASLGGTPYAGLRTREVRSRILQGLRLPQTRYMSDQLFQLMLTTWMTDPSERPGFADILQTLSEMLSSAQALLSFSQFPGFQYEAWVPELEQVSPS